MWSKTVGYGLLGAIAISLQGVNGLPQQPRNNTSNPPSLPPTSTNISCPGSFTPISAQTFIDEMNPGWNLGNTLDAIETEGSWNNPPVEPSTFDHVRAAGFKGVRIPVTWAYHFISESPDWTIDTAWLQRVEDVVDMALERGLPAIVNVHHDSWIWTDPAAPGANLTMIEEKFYRLWVQVGRKLACKGSGVAFETINEPAGTTEEHAALVNRLNEIFLTAISDAGGFNSKRVVTLVGLNSDSVKTSLWFKGMDEGRFSNPWALQYHYYSPYDFIFSAWGKTIWGSPSELSTLETDLAIIRSNFSSIPLIIGEWAASPVATEPAARQLYFDFFLRTAAKYNTPTVLWDNGNDFLDRANGKWRDPVALDILRTTVVDGERSALPGGTTDASSPTQESSAQIWHEYNTTVDSVTLPFDFAGNTLLSASVTMNKRTDKPRRIRPHVDYTNNTITFPRHLLTSIGLNPRSPPSLLATITLRFTAGADLTIPMIQYRTPTLSISSSPLPSTSEDLLIPIPWSSTGQTRPATIKATKSDGTFLVDDWTQWLGPLQQGRMTFSNHWDWDARGVIIRAAALEEVRKAGKSTVFRVEFYPRREGNWVEFTVTV